MTNPTLRSRLLSLPKAELHVHLDGSLRPQTMLELARARGVTLPAAESPEALERFMRADDTADLVQYLAKFALTLSVMQDAEALERITRELVEDHASEGVRWVEIRFSPVLNTEGGLSMDEVMEATVRGLEQGVQKTGISGGLILCALRNQPPSVALEIAKVAVRWKDRGVLAFDLAGAEAGHPAHHHLEAFQFARRGNVPLTIHAGEAWGADSIHDALHRCGASRIGHGTRLEEDPELLRWVRDRQIPIEICLTSNVQTRVAKTFEAHPVARYLRAGIPLTLCTDNRLVSGTTVTDEYLLAAEHLGLTWDDLVRIARMGFESAFLPWPEKLEALRRFDAEVVGI
jgi:adenosine deaminase